MKFYVTQDGLEYEIEATITGRFESQGWEYPGAAPYVDIDSVEPDIPPFDEQDAKVAILEELSEKDRRRR